MPLSEKGYACPTMPEAKGLNIRTLRSALFAAIAAAGLGGNLGCGTDETACLPIEKANVGYGHPRGSVTLNAFLRTENNGNMPIQAPFEIRNSFGKCFKGKTTKHVNLSPDTYTVDWLPVTDPIELSEIRRKTGVVGDIRPPDLEDPSLSRYKEIDVANESTTVTNGNYTP